MLTIGYFTHSGLPHYSDSSWDFYQVFQKIWVRKQHCENVGVQTPATHIIYDWCNRNIVIETYHNFHSAPWRFIMTYITSMTSGISVQARAQYMSFSYITVTLHTATPACPAGKKQNKYFLYVTTILVLAIAIGLHCRSYTLQNENIHGI